MHESEAESQTSLSSPSQKFVPQEDDEETLWEVICITGEKGKTYKVQWKGVDPKTQKPWPQSWVKKSDCTDDLVIEWKRLKKERAKNAKRGKNSLASKKSGRASTSSTVAKGSTSNQPVASTSKLSRRSTSTTTAATAKPRGVTRSTETATPTGRKSKARIEEEDELESESDDEPPKGKQKNGRISNLNTKKRKLIDANSAPTSANLKSHQADDADEGGNPLQKHSTGRPKKKRKVEVEVVKFDPEEEEMVSRKSLSRSQSKPGTTQESYPLQKVRGKAAVSQGEDDEDEDEEEERMVEDALSEAASPPPAAGDDGFYTDDDAMVVVSKTKRAKSASILSSPPSPSSPPPVPVKIGPPTRKRPTSKPNPEPVIKKPLFDPPSPEPSHHSSRSGSLPSLQYPDQDVPAPPQNSYPPAPTQEPSVVYDEYHEPILSPGAVEKLAEFDEDVIITQREEENEGEKVTQKPGLTFALDPSSPLHRMNTNDHATNVEIRSTTPKQPEPPTNSYENEIVPETDESQSQELKLPIAGPSTPKSTTTTISRPGSLKSRMKPRSRTPASPSITSKKDRPLRPIPMLSPSTFHPLLPIPELDSSLPDSIIEPADRSGDAEDLDAPMSSIEEFDSPQKDRSKAPTALLKGKARERSKSAVSTVNGRESASEIWDSQVVQRGQALAEAAKKNNGFDVPSKPPKRTVEEIQVAAAASRNRQASTEVDEEDEDMEDLSTIPVPPASGPPAVMDEDSRTLQEMEAAYVDLSGGTGEPPIDPTQLRQEEEESTQDLMFEFNQVQHQQRGMDSIDLEGGWGIAPAAASNNGSEQGSSRGGRLEAIPEIAVENPSRAASARPYSPESSPPRYDPRARLRSRSRTPAVVVNQKKSRRNSKSESVVLPAHPPSRRSATPAVRPTQDGPSLNNDVHPPEPEPAPSAPETKPQELAALEAQLSEERKAHTEEIQALRTAAEEKESLHKAQVDEVTKQLADVNTQRASEKAAWEAERERLLAQVESAMKSKANAENDREFFREQHARASGFVTSVRDENQELEKRIKIAEEQTQNGVGLIKATFELRVKTLEEDAKSWRKMAEFLIEKDRRSNNDELRRRAAEEPELRLRCERQQGALEADEDRIEQLELQLEEKESDLAVAEVEIQRWKKETTQLHVDLNEALTKLDRIGRAGAGDDSMDGSPDGHEFVYLCKWRPDDADEGEACREVFATISELEQHLVSASGHLQQHR